MLTRIIFFVLAFPISLFAEIIASSNRIDWIPGVTVGVPGGIPVRTNIHVTLSAGSTAAQINSAIANCPSNRVVMLGPGLFSLSTAITFGGKDGVTLRGSGVSETWLSGDADNQVDIHGESGDAGVNPMINPVSLVSGYTKGSSNVVASSVSRIAVGTVIVVCQNDEPFVRSYGPTEGYLKQRVKVIELNGNSITFWPPLVWTFKSALSPRYHIAGDQVELSGVEDLSFVYNSAVDNYVSIQNAYGCWAKNIGITNIHNQGIYLQIDSMCEVRHCSVTGSTSTADGYAFVLNWDNTGALIEDNIAVDQRHSIIASQISGCAFSFNFSTNNWPHNAATMQTAAYNCNHTAHGIMDLWEGNVGNHFLNDGYHGSTSHQTLWRNYFHGTQNAWSNAHNAMVCLVNDSYWHQVVGNIFGSTWLSVNHHKYFYEITAAQWDAAATDDNGGVYMLGYVGYSQPLNTQCADTMTRFYNYDYWNQSIQSDVGLSGTVDKSLLYLSKPAWFGNRPWPPFDSARPMDVSAMNIPSGYRFYMGDDPPLEAPPQRLGRWRGRGE